MSGHLLCLSVWSPLQSMHCSAWIFFYLWQKPWEIVTHSVCKQNVASVWEGVSAQGEGQAREDCGRQYECSPSGVEGEPRCGTGSPVGTSVLPVHSLFPWEQLGPGEFSHTHFLTSRGRAVGGAG